MLFDTPIQYWSSPTKLLKATIPQHISKDLSEQCGWLTVSMAQHLRLGGPGSQDQSISMSSSSFKKRTPPSYPCLVSRPQRPSRPPSTSDDQTWPSSARIHQSTAPQPRWPSIPPRSALPSQRTQSHTCAPNPQAVVQSPH